MIDSRTNRFYIPTDGNWSGGGRAVLLNFKHAVCRHDELSFDDGSISVINRNIPLRGTKRPYVLIPQNAWPWAGPKLGVREHIKLGVMRTGSELAMRRALGVIRAGRSIPEIGPIYERTIPNPLDPGFEDAVANLSTCAPLIEGRYFVSVGSLNSYRGIEFLLSAYRSYRSEGGRIPLHVIGGAKPHYLQHLERSASGLDGVHLHPEGVSRRESLILLRNASAAVLPSHVEASPFSLLEALAVQSNVLASDIPGHYDIVPRDAPHPRYFSHTDVATLATLLAASSAVPSEPSHPLTSTEYRESERVRWGNELVEGLKMIVDRARR